VIAAVVLAAGEATRFGATKQLERYRGKPLVQRAVDAARGAGIEDVVVVVGHDAERVAAAVTDARTVLNARYTEGQSARARTPSSSSSPISLGSRPNTCEP
jgi:molybdenum cofactor cytidylyltransferase